VVNTLDSLGYPESFDETFEQWIFANYLDNKTYLNGRYGYIHYNFPPCRVAASITQFPSGSRTDSVRSYAVDYIRFSSTIPRDIYIQFDGVDTSQFRLAVLKLGSTNSQIYSVESISLDSLNSASFYVDSLGMDVQKIIMVVMNTDPYLGENKRASYTYSAESISGIKAGFNEVLAFSLFQNYPNPFNPVTRIKYEIPELCFVTLKVFDVLGNEVATLVRKEKLPGEYIANFYGNGLTSGIYFYQLKAGNYIETKKMLVIK